MIEIFLLFFYYFLLLFYVFELFFLINFTDTHICTLFSIDNFASVNEILIFVVNIIYLYTL